MKKQVLAVILAAALCAGPGGIWQTRALADTAVIEDDGGDIIGAEGIDWKLRQTLSASSCRQGKTVTLTVSLAGDAREMELSTIYARLKYDAKVFRLGEKDVTPTQSALADYITFDKNLGEVDVYYTGDIRVERGTALLKLKFHVRPGAAVGKTKLGVKELELYATDSDDYAVIEHTGTVTVNIEKGTGAALRGDVNQDKKVDLKDVKLIMKHCNNGTKLTAAQKKNADVNGDGRVSLTDAKLVMKYCNGEIKKL